MANICVVCAEKFCLCYAASPFAGPCSKKQSVWMQSGSARKIPKISISAWDGTGLNIPPLLVCMGWEQGTNRKLKICFVAMKSQVCKRFLARIFCRFDCGSARRAPGLQGTEQMDRGLHARSPELRSWHRDLPKVLESELMKEPIAAGGG